MNRSLNWISRDLDGNLSPIILPASMVGYPAASIIISLSLTSKVVQLLLKVTPGVKWLPAMSVGSLSIDSIGST